MSYNNYMKAGGNLFVTKMLNQRDVAMERQREASSHVAPRATPKATKPKAAKPVVKSA